MQETQLKRFLLLGASAALASAAVYFGFRYVLWWLLPFLIAFGVSTLLEPVILFLQQRLHFRRTFSAAMITLFLLFLAGGLLSFFFSTLFREANAFLSQAGTTLAHLPELMQSALDRLKDYCALCPPWLQEYINGAVDNWAQQSSVQLDTLVTHLLSALASLAAALPRTALGCATTVLAIYFTSSAYPLIGSALRKRFSHGHVEQMRQVRSGILRSIGRWLRAELTLCTLTFFQLLFGFFLIRQDFSLLLAFLITLVDALPVFGTGTVLVPWALLCFFFGNTPKALCLLVLYACTLLVRNILEPKLMAKHSGLPPIASLAAMYLGFCTFGVAGMVLFPFLLLLAMQLKQNTDADRAGARSTL